MSAKTETGAERGATRGDHSEDLGGGHVALGRAGWLENTPKSTPRDSPGVLLGGSGRPLGMLLPFQGAGGSPWGGP